MPANPWRFSGLALVVASLLCPASISGQTSPVNPTKTPFGQSATKRVTLDLGSVTVWLGMPKEDALSKFTSAGYRVMNPGSNKTIVINDKHIYTVGFALNRLRYADRPWYSSDTDPIDSVVGALKSLVEGGEKACAVTAAPIVDFTFSSERIFISCGKRSVLIIRGIFKGKVTFDVWERVGTFPE